MAITLDSIDAALHSIKVSDGTNDLALDGSGFITTNINGTVSVSATNLDIRDLTHVSDSVKIGDGTDFLAVAADGSIAITDNGGSLTIDNADLVTIAGDTTSIDGKLAALGQGVMAGSMPVVIASDQSVLSIDDNGGSLTVDGTVAATQSGVWNVNTTPGGYGSWKVTAQSVTTTESELAATPLASRLSVLVQNLGNDDIYLKEATGVSSSNAMKLPKGSSFEANLDDGSNLFAIADSSSSDIRVVEYAA